MKVSEGGRYQGYIVSLADGTDHYSVQVTTGGKSKTMVNTKLRLLGCLELLIIHQFINTITGTASLLNPYGIIDGAEYLLNPLYMLLYF